MPDEVDRVVRRALAKAPHERYQSAEEFVKALLPSRAVPLALLAVAPSGVQIGGTEKSARGDLPTTAAVPVYLPSSEHRVWEFASLWDELALAAHENKERFVALTDTLVRGPLREAIGYRIGDPIPYFKGTVGYMVEAPFLWIRQSRFPLLFVAYDRGNPDLLTTVVHQLELARATEYFALLVVTPPQDAAQGGSGRGTAPRRGAKQHQ